MTVTLDEFIAPRSTRPRKSGGIMTEENPQEPEIAEPEAKPKKVAAVKGPVIMPHTARARAAVLAKLKNK